MNDYGERSRPALTQSLELPFLVQGQVCEQGELAVRPLLVAPPHALHLEARALIVYGAGPRRPMRGALIAVDARSQLICRALAACSA